MYGLYLQRNGKVSAFKGNTHNIRTRFYGHGTKTPTTTNTDPMPLPCGGVPLAAAQCKLPRDAPGEEVISWVLRATSGPEAAREDTPTLAEVAVRRLLLAGAVIPGCSADPTVKTSVNRLSAAEAEPGREASPAAANEVRVEPFLTVRRARLFACPLLAEEVPVDVDVDVDERAPLLRRFSPGPARRAALSPTAVELGLPSPLSPVEDSLLETPRRLTIPSSA